MAGDSTEGDKLKKDDGDDDDTGFFEIMLFTLSPVLGGRDNVLATPFMECLKYVELENKRKKSDRWNNFMDMFYSAPDIDKDKRKAYVESIQPEKAKKKMEMKTDRSQLEKLKAEQMAKK